MTDKKFTDKEIIYALELCNKSANVEICESCPFMSNYKCIYLLKANALVLINRQKSEIERLKKRISGQKHALFEQQAYTAELQNEIVKLEDYNEKLLAANTGLANSNFIRF